MAIGVAPEDPAQVSDADAEALFEEAREIERRRRRRKWSGVSALAGVALAVGIGFGLAGGGGGPSPARHGSGGAGSGASGSHQPRVLRGTVAASASVCSLASRPATVGNPPPGQCVTTLPNGHLYQCPIGVVNSFGANAAQAATDDACHRVAAPTIPTSWRPTILQVHRVEACIRAAGMTAAGSAVPPVAQRAYPDMPIATVMISRAESQPTTIKLTASPSGSRPAIVDFYLTAAQARQAYKRTIPTVTRQGQAMGSHGRVLYTWNKQAGSQAATERRCIQAI